MAKYAHADVLDGGLLAIKNSAIRLLLVKAYTPGDAFSTVMGNAICTVVMAPADFVLTGTDNAPRVMTVAAKIGIASANSGGAPDLWGILTDNVSKVLYATDETSNQVISLGNTVSFPSFIYTIPQPI